MKSITFDDGVPVYAEGFDTWADGWSYVDNGQEA